MKAIKTGSKIIFCMSAALAVMFASGCATNTDTADQMKPMKGAEMLMMKPINTQAQVDELQPGDSIAMVCSMCKSVVVHNVTTEKGHIKVMTIGEKHLCPGCNSIITTVGVGRGPKGAHNEVKHVCEKCGGESAFCCATKAGEGATKGMEEDKR